MKTLSERFLGIFLGGVSQILEETKVLRRLNKDIFYCKFFRHGDASLNLEGARGTRIARIV